MFDWSDLLVDGVLSQFRAGAAVRYRPPAWDERDRAGAIEVPAGTPVLLVEGVGSSRAALTPRLPHDAATEVVVADGSDSAAEVPLHPRSVSPGGSGSGHTGRSAHASRVKW